MRNIHFNKIRISPSLRPVLENAENRIGALSGEEFHIVKFMFGKISGCDLGDILLISMATFSRPPTLSMVVIDRKKLNKILVPAYDKTDFEECCQLLEVESESDRKTLYDFCGGDASKLRR